MAQLVLPLGSRPALGREDFIVGEGNREAVAFIDAWPDWPAPVAALHGPAGSGKSHLAAIWSARANAAIVEASKLDDTVAAPLVVEQQQSIASAAFLEAAGSLEIVELAENPSAADFRKLNRFGAWRQCHAAGNPAASGQNVVERDAHGCTI